MHAAVCDCMAESVWSCLRIYSVFLPHKHRDRERHWWVLEEVRKLPGEEESKGRWGTEVEREQKAGCWQGGRAGGRCWWLSRCSGQEQPLACAEAGEVTGPRVGDRHEQTTGLCWSLVEQKFPCSLWSYMEEQCHGLTPAGTCAPQCHLLSPPPAGWGRESEE